MRDRNLTGVPENAGSFTPTSAIEPPATTDLGRFRPYPAYKDSGVEWLGPIPAHWEVMASKRLGDFQAGAGFPNEEQGLGDEELPFYKVSDMNLEGNETFMVNHNNSISRESAARLAVFIFPPETIVFAKVGAALLLNKRRILTRESCIDNNIMGFMRKGCDLKWAYYWMCGLDLGDLANPGAVPSVNEGQLRSIPVPVPPESEQRAIAAFLDREAAKIDALVEKKERLIALLQEKRTALISHAVTKGLDPTVPMKDSGVEWLGPIPAHWKVKPLKRALRSGNADGSLIKGRLYQEAQDGLFPGFSASGQDVWVEEAQHHEPGIVLSAVGARCGKTFKADGDWTAVANTHVFFSHAGFDRDFLWYLTNDEAFWDRGGTAQPFVRVASTLQRPWCFPPLPEQRAIVAFLDRETAKIDALIAKVREVIERLKEYRTALISAAVTGKIDVRELGSEYLQEACL